MVTAVFATVFLTKIKITYSYILFAGFRLSQKRINHDNQLFSQCTVQHNELDYGHAATYGKVCLANGTHPRQEVVQQQVYALHGSIPSF